MLSPNEFAYTMKFIVEKCGDDPEKAHWVMDTVMAQLLSDFGYDEGIRTFNKFIKWYA